MPPGKKTWSEGTRVSKIKVVTCYEDVVRDEQDVVSCPYKDITTANMREYCKRWGYEFVGKFDGWRPTRQPHHHMWHRVELLLDEIHDCDWILCIDLDCFFLNMTIPLEGIFTDETADLIVTGGFDACADCGKPTHNVGVVCFRNCDWSRETLHDWWNQEIEARRENPDKQYTYCVGECGWISCHVCNNPDQKSHVKVVPLKIAGWASITGKPEQLLTHQYAAPNSVKLERFRELEHRVIR